jgi:hypothetical protein
MCIMSARAVRRLEDGTGIFKVKDYTYDKKWCAVLMTGTSSVRQRAAGTCLGDILLHADVSAVIHELYFSDIFFDARGKRIQRGVVLRNGSPLSTDNHSIRLGAGLSFYTTPPSLLSIIAGSSLPVADLHDTDDTLCVKYMLKREGSEANAIMKSHGLFQAQVGNRDICFGFLPFGFPGVDDLEEWNDGTWVKKTVWKKWFDSETKDMELLFTCLAEGEVMKDGKERIFLVGMHNWDMDAWRSCDLFADNH